MTNSEFNLTPGKLYLFQRLGCLRLRNGSSVVYRKGQSFMVVEVQRYMDYIVIVKVITGEYVGNISFNLMTETLPKPLDTNLGPG